MKKKLALILAAMLVFAGCNQTAETTEAVTDPQTDMTEGTEITETTEGAETEVPEQSGEMQDGTYEQVVNGYGGEMTVVTTIEGGQITSITADDNKETVPVFSRALPVLQERLLEAQSPEIHTVSGATFSSDAVMTAVKQAMEEAGAVDVPYGLAEIAMIEEAEDMNTNVLVIGGGPSGLSAAIEAKLGGAEHVLLIEKLDILSGNGKFDMNFFDMPNSQAMAANGVEVSKEEFLEMKENAIDSPERKQAWIDGAWELDAWLRDLGVELNFNYGGDKGMNHMAEEDEYSGDVIQHGLEDKAKDAGVEIMTGTNAVDLLFEDNRVTGANVIQGRKQFNINADAVIVATGGFSHNPELLAEYAPGSENIATSNQMGATGDFVKIFEEHDIQLGHMDTLSVFKMILTKNRELTGAGDGFILVNQNGERFADESSSGLPLAQEIKAQDKVFYIYDTRLKESMYRLQKHNDLGYHVSAEGVDALAEEIGIPAEALQANLDQYNAGVNGEEDPIRPEPSEFAIDTEGTLYAAQVESAIHMTKGGVVANEKAQVLNNAGEVVPGLYASGEVTDTAGAYSASVVFGRIAGQEAAAFIQE